MRNEGGMEIERAASSYDPNGKRRITPIKSLPGCISRRTLLDQNTLPLDIPDMSEHQPFTLQAQGRPAPQRRLSLRRFATQHRVRLPNFRSNGKANRSAVPKERNPQ